MKALFASIWLTIVGAFLLGEFTNLSLTHWWLPTGIGVAFLSVELFCAFTRNGCTFSEFTWGFSEQGYMVGEFPVRSIPAWVLTAAMALRLAATARLIDGEDVSAHYWSGHLPLDAFLWGVTIWLAFHFASLGKYRSS